MMADYRTIETGSTDERGFTLVAKATGSPITSGTVNWYLQARSGANAGKWWRISDNSWQASETANAMTHQADGHWTRALDQSPFADGVACLEYAREAGDLHVPVARWLKAGYTPSANSSRQVTEINSAAILEDTGTTLPAQIGALNNLSQAQAQTAATAALNAYDPPTYAELEVRTLASPSYATAAAQGSLATALTALADKFAGITSLANWLRLLGRKDPANATAKSEYNASGGSYDETTDSQQGQTDTGGAGLTAEAVRQAVWVDAPSRTLTMVAAQILEALRGSTIVLTRGVYQSVTLTVGSLVGATELYVTVKAYPDTETDADAILQVSLTTGLLRLNGAAGTAGDAELTVVDEEEGVVTLTLAATAAAQLAPTTKLRYDLKAVVAGKPRQMTTGRCDILADVTRAVS